MPVPRSVGGAVPTVRACVDLQDMELNMFQQSVVCHKSRRSSSTTAFSTVRALCSAMERSGFNIIENYEPSSLEMVGVKPTNVGEIIMRVVQNEQPSSAMNEASPADICQSSILERPSAKQPDVVSKIAISSSGATTTASPVPTISVIVTPSGFEPLEDSAVLPEQDVEIDLVTNQLTETEPVMPPSPADDLVMQMVAGENLLPDKADTRSDAAIARVVAANPDAPLLPPLRRVPPPPSPHASPLSLLAIAKAQQKMSVEKKEQEAMLRLIEKGEKLRLTDETSAHHQPSRGEVIVFGKGGDGQLGIRTDKSGFQPTPIPIPITSSLAIRQVACGKNHTMLLTDSGDVYTFGASTMGQCGHGHLNSTKVPTLVKELEGVNVRQISAGENHSACATDTGKLITFGCGLFGQLGISENVNRLTPAMVRFAPHEKHVDIKSVVCGANHTIAISDSGVAFAFGRNDNGQLGHGAKSNDVESTPKPVTALMGSSNKVAQAAAGMCHSLFLLENGEVFSCGRGRHGRLGLGTTESHSDPQHVFTLSNQNKLRKLAAGRDFSIALDSDGGIWTWGSGSLLSMGGKAVDSLLPQRLGILCQFRDVVCGERHAAAISESHELYTFGEGTGYKLGHGSEAAVAIPSPVSSLSNTLVRQVACGAGHTVALTSNLSLIASDLRSLFSNQELADIAVCTAAGKRILAHKVILTLRCEYFRKILCEHPKLAEITVEPVIRAESLLLAMEFIYTATAVVPPALAADVMIVAEKLQLPELRALAECVSKRSAASLSGSPSSSPLSQHASLGPAPSTTLVDLRGALRLSDFADVTFQFANAKSQLAHRAVLCARSDYFRSMFASGMKESGQAVVPIDDVRYPVFQRILEYVYTSEVDLTDGALIIELFMAANKYRLYGLKSMCEGVIEGNVDTENVFTLIQLSQMYSSTRIRSACVDLMRKHYDTLHENEEFLGLPSDIRNEVHKETETVSRASLQSRLDKEDEIVPHIVAKPSRALAEAVIKARKAQKLSRDQLARSINEKVSVIAGIENAQCVPRRSVIQKVERSLHTKLMTLLPPGCPP